MGAVRIPDFGFRFFLGADGMSMPSAPYFVDARLPVDYRSETERP